MIHTACIFLFGGLFARFPTTPTGWQWLLQANPLFWAFQAVAESQFYCESSGGESDACPVFVQPPVPFPIVVWPFTRDWLGITVGTASINLGYVAAFVLGYAAVAIISIQLRVGGGPEVCRCRGARRQQGDNCKAAAPGIV